MDNNHEGCTFVIPVGDLAQHVLATISYFTQNGYTIYDDIAKRPIPGTEKFGDLVDVNKSTTYNFGTEFIG